MTLDCFDENFNEQFSVYKIVCVAIYSFVLIIRCLIVFFISYEVGLGHFQLHVMIMMFLVLLMIFYLENCSVIIKKIFFFFLIEILSISNRFQSFKIAPEAETVLCMNSTLLLMLFQTSIFKSNISISLLMVKHLLLWIFVDFDNYSLKTNFGGKEGLAIVTSLIILLNTSFFEYSKRANLLSKYQAKLESQAAHDQIYETLKFFPDGLIIFDEDFIEKFKNHSMVSLIPNSEDSLCNKLFRYKIGPEEVSLLNLINEFLANEKQLNVSLGKSSINGTQYEWRVHKIKWDSSKCNMLIARDVTKILEFERISAENHTKNLIIRSISHEFRTPINGISMIIDEISNKVSEEIKEKISYIKTCTELLNFQLNDIIDYSDLTSNKFIQRSSEENLREKLKSCLDLIKFQAKYKGLQLSLKFEGMHSLVVVDGYRVQKVVMNFLTNALKYTQRGSIELFAIQKGNVISIGVKDTGIGIQKESLAELQNELRCGSNCSLSGVGLFISQKILEKYNSCLRISSKIAGGTTCSFDIENLDDSQESLERIEVGEDLEIPVESSSRSSIREFITNTLTKDFPKILIVDDNEFNRMCLANILKEEGFRVEEAVDGQDCIERVLKYEKLNKPFKCIIMDLNMPIMDGLEATRLIRQMYCQGQISSFPYIIGHTAFSDKDIIKRCHEVGMIYWIPKPCPREEIAMIVKQFY